MLIEKFLKQAKEEIIMDTVLSDEFMDKVQDNFAPIESLMAYYRCAIMEVETKFNVLNEQFSLQYDRNPIESIKARVKSFDSIFKESEAETDSVFTGIHSGKYQRYRRSPRDLFISGRYLYAGGLSAAAGRCQTDRAERLY